MIQDLLFSLIRGLRIRKIADTCSSLLMMSEISFAAQGRGLSIGAGSLVKNGDCIEIGNDVALGKNARLFALKKWGDQRFTPAIKIGSMVRVTGDLQIYCVASVTIEEGVLIANNVFIGDCSHGHQINGRFCFQQDLDNIAPILIGRGCWLGQNVVIMPGVTVGAGSVIGANSVVTKNIPEKSIAVGCPARVVKSWCDVKKGWVRV